MRRKYLKFHDIAVTAIILAVMAVSGCGNQVKESETQKGDTVATHEAGSVTVVKDSSPLPFPTDSVRKEMTSASGRAEVYIDYPQNDDAASREAKTFIRHQLFGDHYNVTADHPDTLARRYCEMTLLAFEQSLRQLHIGTVSQEEAPEEGIEIRLIYVSDEYITYESWHYAYFTGGGHGTYGTQGVTIRRADGKRMTHLVKENERLRRQILKGLMTYFGVTDEASLSHYLTVPLELLPMPAHPPYLTAEGMRFQYELYDICCLDDGAPAFTIPLDSLDVER